MIKAGIDKFLIGIAWVLITIFPLTSLAEPYFVNKEGNLIWDKATGLVWMRCSLGQTWNGKSCSGKASGLTISKGQKAAKDLNDQGGYAGAKDWGLPSIRQLASLRTCSKGFVTDKIDLKDGGSPLPFFCADGSAKPTIHPYAFPATSGSSYWSYSPFVGGSANMYRVINFGDGASSTTNGDTDSAFAQDGRTILPIGVRLVRAKSLLAGDAAVDFAKELPAGKTTSTNSAKQ